MVNYKQARPEQVESFISPATFNGMLRAVTPDKSVWLYAAIPWSTALTDGATDTRRINAATQLMSFFDGLASQVSAAGLKYRSLLRGQYRQFHLLTGAVPQRFQSANQRGSMLARWQNGAYTDVRVQRQFAVIGVRLHAGAKDPISEMRNLPWWRRGLVRFFTELDNVSFNIANGFPRFEEFEDDMHVIQRIMLNAGLKPFSMMDDQERSQYLEVLRSWWVSNGSGALGVMPDNDHLHMFPDMNACVTAQHAYDDGKPCKDWNIRGEYPATLCFAQSTSFNQNSISDPSNLWLAKLLEVPEAGGAGAVGVSIRGTVEPGIVTAAQIRRHTSAINDAIKERYAKGREASGDMEDMMEKLEYKRSIYRHDNMPPTLIDLSVAALVAGNAQQAIDALGVIPNMTFVNMNTSSEQYLGFKSMQACSPVRMTPFNMEWSGTIVAGSGVNSMAKAGDGKGACLGFTEANSQPVYLSTTFASDQDTVPFLAIVGKSGSGKTMALINLMRQWCIYDSGQGATPCIFIDPKEDSDFSDTVLQAGGTVYSMDSDISNGQFDPLNVIPNKEEAKEMAAIMFADIFSPGVSNPDLEISLTVMLDYGLKAGAHVSGVALKLANDAFMAAQQAGQPTNLPANTHDVYEHVMKLIASNQFLRIICGTDNNAPSLSVSRNLTLIRAGARSLVPAEGSENTVTGRIQRWVLRMTVMGAGVAVRGRDGVVALDEAWVALGKGSGETVQQWARLARSQRFLPVLASQKVQEFIDAGLEGSISRGLILANDDPAETNGTVSQAKAALRLFSIEDTDGHIARRMALDPEKDGGEPNWDSLQRLKDPQHPGRVLRGSVAYFKDGSNMPVPVEIRINPDLLAQISTSRLDVLAREQHQAA